MGLETQFDSLVPVTLVLVLVELPLRVLGHHGQPQQTSPRVQHLEWVGRLCSPLVEWLCSPLELQDQLGPLLHTHLVLVLATVGILPLA